MNHQVIDFIPLCSSLEIDRATQARVSDDYYIDINRQIPQWNTGITSMFANVSGIVPVKDVCWSNQYQPVSPYKEAAEEILISILSTGPVAFYDGINYVDKDRIMRCCRQDDLILKPTKSLI